MTTSFKFCKDSQRNKVRTPCGLSSVFVCNAAPTRFTTAKTYSRSLLSRVGTFGLCPLTPSVA